MAQEETTISNPTQTQSTPKKSRTEGRICGFLKLAPTVTLLNFLSYLFAALFTVCFFVFLNASQGFVLGQILKVPETELGTYAGSLTFYDELFSLVFVWLWGLASDFIGRRTVYSLSYILMALGLFIFTYAQNVYPQLLIFRIIFASGGSAASSMLTAVLADYAGDEDRGKVSAIVGMMTGCGALVALFVFLRIPSTTADPVAGLRKAYFIVGGISAVVGVVLFFTLRRSYGKAMELENQEVKRAKSVNGAADASSGSGIANSTTGLLSSGTTGSSQSLPKRRPVWVVALEGIKAARDPVILVGYIGGFLARADSVLVTTFIPLWVYKFYISRGLCSARNPSEPDIAETCRQAYVLSSTLSGVCQTMTLVGAPFFGILGDKVYRPLSVFIASLFGFIGYIMIYSIDDPTSKIMYLAVSLVGIGEIGLIVGSLSLVTAKYVPADIRGSVAGVYSTFGAVGILITSKLGGSLFDSWVETAPFFLMFIARVVALPIIIFVIVKDVLDLIKERRGKQPYSVAESGENGGPAAVNSAGESQDEVTAVGDSHTQNETLLVALKNRFLAKSKVLGTTHEE
ncbi:hypothetical protein HK098_002839 [Nowakowskiella sp. JEL0407]|nr:hypothetical protein HK098_002839 [Nowakowskiella sp. JEL0407]